MSEIHIKGEFVKIPESTLVDTVVSKNDNLGLEMKIFEFLGI